MIKKDSVCTHYRSTKIKLCSLLHNVCNTLNFVSIFHLLQARSFKGDIPSHALPVFLCTTSISSYLNRVQKCDFDVFHPKMQSKDSLLPIKLWLQNKRKTYWKDRWNFVQRGQLPLCVWISTAVIGMEVQQEFENPFFSRHSDLRECQ